VSHAAPSHRPRRGFRATAARAVAALAAALLATAALLAVTATPAHADPEERYGIPTHIDAESGGRNVWDVIIPDFKAWDGLLYSGTPLPEGLQLRTTPEDDIYLVGTAPPPGTYPFEISALRPGVPEILDYTVEIRSAPVIAWVDPTLPTATAGSAYDVALSDPRTWETFSTSGTLPPGLTLTADGRIAGTPTTPGTVTFTVTAERSWISYERTFELTVHPAPAVELLVDGWPFEGWPAGVQADASGLAPFSDWAITLLPSGTQVANGRADASGLAVVDAELDVPVPFGAHELRFTGTAADGTPLTDSVWFSVGEDGEIVELSTSGPVAEPPRASPGGPTAPASGDAAGDPAPAAAVTGVTALANTGADPTPWIIAAGVLLVAGLGAVVATSIARRRRR
jgi:hypothetical protein